MKMSKLLALALVLLISVGTLAGSTIAWFTDEVTSTNNVIKSGTLDLVVSYKDKVNDDWSDLEKTTTPLFSYDLWEPGYTSYKFVQLENKGSLAFRYQLNLKADVDADAAYKLADVIDVYMLPADAEPSRDSFKNTTPVGTLSKLMAETDGAAHGIILPAEGKGASAFELSVADQDKAVIGSTAVCIGLKMQETAGNEYQGLSVGDGITLDVLATQYTYEKDSFDNQYDKDAWGEVAEKPTVNAEGVVEVWTAEQLAGVMADLTGVKTVEIMNDINLAGRKWTPADLWNSNGASLQLIDGNGHTISNMTTSGDRKIGFIGSNRHSYTIKDLTFENARVEGLQFAGTVIGYMYGNITLENVDVIDSNIACHDKAPDKGIRAGGLIGFVPPDGGTLTLKDCDVTDSTITGYHNVGAMVGTTLTQKTVTIDNCTAKNNTLLYRSTRVGAFDFGASTDGYTEYVPESGFTAENNTIALSISTADEFLNLGGDNKSHEGVISIEADIDLNGAAMPTIGAAYGKTLIVYGNGHTISNGTTAHTSHNGMKHHGMFYAYTNSTLTINDLNFEDITIDATKDTERNYGAGIVVCFADGGSMVTLNDVDVNNCDILNSTPEIGDEAGVYVGYQTGTLVMKDCNSIGCTVAGETTEKTGAFIGMVNGTATLTSCTTDLTIGVCNRVGVGCTLTVQ